MTNLRWLLAGLLLSVGLAACTPPADPVVVTRPVIVTEMAATAVPTTGTATPASTHTAAPRPRATITPPPTPLPTPTPLPALSPEALAQMVAEGLSWTAVPGMDGFPLWQLSDFEYGLRYMPYGYCEFGPYRWLTDDQLLLFPIVDHTSWFEEPTMGKVTQPIVFNAAAGTAWLPDTPRTDVCDLPVWSATRQQLIEASDGEVRLRNLAGNVVATYPGSMPLFIAPSGQRLLAGQTWIDLTTGEQVQLDGWQRVKFPRPAWSSDETEIFECCFSYVNVATGESWTRQDLPDLWVGGIGAAPGYFGSASHWVADDDLVIIEPNNISFFNGSDQPALPLIDPASKTIINIVEAFDLPTNLFDCFSQLTPMNSQLWFSCIQVLDDGYTKSLGVSYLVALPELNATTFTGEFIFRGWSADGRFYSYDEITDLTTNEGATWLAQVNGNQWQIAADPLATEPLERQYWHPTQPLALMQSGRSNRLLLIDTTSLTRQLDFPYALADVAWQPNGDGIVLLTTDNALFWLDELFAPDSEPQRIAPDLAEINNVRWSPNGHRLAFISGNSFYVIDMTDN
ncbi:hypothetical protein [Candidatus Leptofilum sp.]|uniref:hypothetical protein n=1 Tax=Candidatus Leptofilum sp. TaxID=3241576 RepID=UPI003B5C4842